MFNAHRKRSVLHHTTLSLPSPMALLAQMKKYVFRQRYCNAGQGDSRQSWRVIPDIKRAV